jgi:hypothetical protein
MTGPKHKADAAIVSLICLLPPEITQLWWDTATLSGCLRRGGVTGITPARLRKALFMTQRLTPATPWKCRLWEKHLILPVWQSAGRCYSFCIQDTDSQPLAITSFYRTQGHRASFFMISRTLPIDSIFS